LYIVVVVFVFLFILILGLMNPSKTIYKQ